MAEAGDKVRAQRLGAVLILLVAGILSLPVAAAFFDGEGTENLILPVQLVGMAVVGTGTGLVLPGLAGAGASRGRAAVFGALVGVGAALVGFALFFVLLNGFGGA